METIQHKYKIGYIDEESSWINKFKLTLKDSFDIVIFKPDANATLEGIFNDVVSSELDCLVVDFELKETELIPFNGDEIIERLRKKYPFFPVFIITSKEEGDVLNQVEDNEIVRMKEELTEKPAILIQRINNKISNYYKEIFDAEEEVKNLVVKMQQPPVNIKDEERLTDLYHYLHKINPDEKLIPDNLIDSQSINQLSDFVSESRQILEELKKLQG